MANSEYRGQDTILNLINVMAIESDGNLTWNEACEIVAEQFDREELTASAADARARCMPVTIT